MPTTEPRPEIPEAPENTPLRGGEPPAGQPSPTGPATEGVRASSDERPDDVAPVDWQADPAHWLPGRALPIVAGVVLVITVVTIVICLVIWITPPMDPLQIPVLDKA